LNVSRGARHGLKLNGKLARIEQQEKQLLAHTKDGKRNILKQNRANMTVSDDISSKDESLHTCNKLLQPEEGEKEIKKKKKSKRHEKKYSAQTVNIQTPQLQSEFHHSDINPTVNGVTKSEKVKSCFADTIGTQNFAATNQARTPEDESVVSRKGKKYKQPRSETEDYTSREGMENMKQEHQNMDSLGTGSEKIKNKWKGIPSKVTSTKETQWMDVAHEEHFGSYSKKRKRKKGTFQKHSVN
jgi:hypothetical protein